MAHAQSRPLVVELFTSEGCSSCPPAEAYLGRLRDRPDVIALAYHVTYWDELGWRDRFGLAQAVERQERYARRLGRAAVYTPQIVLDGRSDALGPDAGAITAALAAARPGVPITLGARGPALSVDVGREPRGGGGEVLLVAYLRHAVSAIGRGENSGRTLEEYNIVREVRRLGRWSGEPASFQVPLASLPPEATDVAVLVQGDGQGPVIGAQASTLR